jgi:RimJ/RimL family protein N-acetyltransferase
VRVWIVEADGVPVGVVRLDSNDEVSIEIDPDHRRKGYGGFALAEVCKRARGRVKANVDSMNTDARMAFEHAGFKEHSDVVFYVWRPDK